MADPLAEYEALRDRLRKKSKLRVEAWLPSDEADAADAIDALCAQVRTLTRERDGELIPCPMHAAVAPSFGDPGEPASTDPDCIFCLRSTLQRLTRERDEARDYIEHLKRNGNFAIAALGDVGKALAVDRDEARAELERLRAAVRIEQENLRRCAEYGDADRASKKIMLDSVAALSQARSADLPSDAEKERT